MSLFWRLLLVSFSLIIANSLVVGCSNSSSDSGGGKNKGGNPIEKLLPEDRVLFLNWQERAVKPCSAGDIFLDSNDVDKNKKYAAGRLVIDVDQWLKKNQGLYQLETKDRVLVFDRPKPFPSSPNDLLETETSHSIEVNGKVIRDVKAQIKDSICTVKLFGEIVFEKKVAESLGVALSFSIDESSMDDESPKKSFIPSDDMSFRPLFSFIRNQFSPTDSSYQWLSEHFNVSLENTKNLFPDLVAFSSEQYTYSFLGFVDDLWYSEEFPRVFLTTPAAQDLILKSGVHKIQVIHKPKSQKFFDYETALFPQGFFFEFDLDIKKSTDWSIEGHQSIYLGQKQDDFKSAKKCLTSRYDIQLEKSSTDGASNLFRPTVEQAFDPCLGLDGNLKNQIFNDVDLHRRVSQRIKGMSSQNGVDYGDWDSFLTEEAMTWALNGVNPNEFINPAGASILTRLSNSMFEVHRVSENKKHRMTLIVPLFYMVSQWAFYPVSQQTSIRNIFNSLSKVVDPFQKSAIYSIERFGYGGSEALEDLQYADSLDESVVNLAVSIKRQADQLKYKEWIDEVFNQFLQKRPSVQELEETNACLSQIANSFKSTKNLDEHRMAITEISMKALQDKLLSSKQVGQMISALDNSIVPFKVSTEELIKNLQEGEDPVVYWPQVTFANQISKEYIGAFEEVMKLSVELKKEYWAKDQWIHVLQDQPSLSKVKSWAESFKASLKFQKMDESLAEGSSSDSFYTSALEGLIERATEEFWSSNDFLTVVQIASLARTSSFCGDYKTNSLSLDRCGNFRKQVTTKEGGFLHSSFENRYGQLAEMMFLFIVKVGDNFDLEQVTRKLRDEFFGRQIVWLNCSNGQFSQKSKELKTVLNSLIKTTDWFEKNELSDQVDELLKDCG